MADSPTALTAGAVSVFRERMSPDYKLEPWYNLWVDDPILQEAQRRSALVPVRHRAIADLAREVMSAELESIASREGEVDPMVLYPSGGMRLSPDSLITGLFSAAFQLIFFLRLPLDEGTYVRTVLEGFDEIRRAARDGRIRACRITGVAGIKLPESIRLGLPWGTLSSAPSVTEPGHFGAIAQPKATCILAEQRLIPIVFDRSPEPKHKFDRAEVSNERARILFPLACALASNEDEPPAGALMTWSTMLVPFDAGFFYSNPILPPYLAVLTDLGGRVKELEEWSRRIEVSHSPSVDVAARRVTSAVARRMDMSDALIDAVMAWENLVGTSTELTYRVTAALAKLLEPDPSRRRPLRKDLQKIYNIRSRIVHGEAVDPSAINRAASRGIDVAVRALRFSYLRGAEWLALSSSERADKLLLEGR